MTGPRVPDELPRMHPFKRAALVRRIAVDWQDRAACLDYPPDDWFPAPADSEAVTAAVQVCASCPVQRSCLAAALVTGETHGIWGGATETDRIHALYALASGASVPTVLTETPAFTRPPEKGAAA